MEKGIQDLAYLIKKAEENNEPKPIVFLGAGASVSGGIPLASGIIKRILKEFKDKPSIKNLSKEKKKDYYELMSALNAKERRKLFQDYIEEAKVNTAHIYLAQMVKLGYVDYVLTVNFDDLLLRACGLYNYTMPTYDISNINEFTTTTFQKQSIIYLHGQHYGEWLLNAEGELDKVKDRIPLLLNKICHDRTWIIAGYSGEDEVFNSIKNFASFDNELYWVNYLNNNPSETVEKNLLNICTKNAHSISGYDADTFFLDLHSKLNLPTPKIIDKPFSFLKSMMDEVQIPEDNLIEDHKELYKSLAERMDISNDWIDRAINDIQEEDSVEKFKQEIIEAYVKGNFEDNYLKFTNKINDSKFDKAKDELAIFYTVWADSLMKKGEVKSNKEFYVRSFEKYQKSVELDSNNEITYYNWGTSLLQLAKIEESEDLYNQSIEKFVKALQLNPYDKIPYGNYGAALMGLGRILDNLDFYYDSINKFSVSVEHFPNDFKNYANWGTALSVIGIKLEDKDLLIESLQKCEKAIKLNPDEGILYSDYVTSLLYLVRITKDRKYLTKALKYAIKAYELNSSAYNLSCVYSRLKEKDNALKFLSISLNNNEINKKYVKDDNDWQHYLEDEDFKALLAKY